MAWYDRTKDRFGEDDMAKKVAVEFQYFESCCFINKTKTEYRYDLQTWINKIKSNFRDLNTRIKEVNNIKGRIENIGLTEDGLFYILNFMRMEEMSNTYLVRESERAQHIDLEDDEYMGKNTVVLYDSKLCVLMVQRNRGGYGISSIESYINSFNDETELCYFRPISNEFNYDRNKGSFLKLDVRFANIKNFKAYDSTAFERIVDACNELECLTAHLEVGLGYTRGEELNADTIQKAISDIRDPRNRKSISTAKVKFSDDQKSEIFDLFDNLIHDVLYFIVPKRGELRFQDMAERMAKQYGEKTRAKVLSLLRSEN